MFFYQKGAGKISWRLKKKIKDILSKETGAVCKDHGGKTRVALVYPNIYSLGMSNLGFQMVYRLFNGIDDCVCERVFLPDEDDLPEFARGSAVLFSYESQTALQQFDVIAFSASFEDDYVNIPKILGLANIPVYSAKRGGGYPLIMAGGVAVSLNPEPLAEIMDLFLIGEGEGTVEGFVDAYRHVRDKGLLGSRADTVQEFDRRCASVYVPSLYEFSYDGVKVANITPVKGAKPRIKAAKNFDLDTFLVPENFIRSPFSEFKDTSLIEIERGCGRGCRFCAAGFVYLPPRWRDVEKIKSSVRRGIEATGKTGLIGTAVSEYPQIKGVIEEGVSLEGTVTLSSLRMDRLDGALLELLKKGGYRTVTLAPEAGSLRMRSVVNKGMTDGDILDTIRLITGAGFNRIKLYFLVGLPGEDDSDAGAIAELSLEIKKLIPGGDLTLSINPFIPKPFTPFEWCAFMHRDVIEKRLSMIKKALSKARGVTVKSMGASDALIQAYISRADRRAGEFIVEAAGTGFRRAARARARFIGDSVYRVRGKDEPLPWDLIDHGLNKKYLWKEYENGLNAILTKPCDVGSCFRCGVCLPELFS